MLDMLIIIGAGVTLVGVCGLAFLALTAPRIEDWEPEEMRDYHAFMDSDRHVPPADPTLGGAAVQRNQRRPVLYRVK